MPSALSLTLSASLLNHYFGNTSYTPLSTIHVAALTTAPSNYATGAGAVQGSGTSRAAVTNNTTNFPAATTSGSAHRKSNGTLIDLGNAPSALTFVAFGLYNASSGGNWLGGGSLNTPVSVSSGSPIRFAAGTLILELTTPATGGLSGPICRGLLDLAFGGSTFTPPSNLHAAYFTAAPNFAAGSGGTEPSAGAYARVSKANNTTNFPNATNDGAIVTKTTGTAYTFPDPTASQGTIVAGGLYDASTAGNLIAAWNLPTNRTLNLTTTNVQFAAGAIQIRLEPVS